MQMDGKNECRQWRVADIKNAIFSLIQTGMWCELISDYTWDTVATPLSCKYSSLVRVQGWMDARYAASGLYQYTSKFARAE